MYHLDYRLRRGKLRSITNGQRYVTSLSTFRAALADRLTEHLRAGVLLDLVPGHPADELLDEDEMQAWTVATTSTPICFEICSVARTSPR